MRPDPDQGGIAKVVIRSGLPADLAALKQLSEAFETWLNRIGGEHRQVDPQRADAFATLMFGEQPLCQLLVAEAQGGVVGYLVYYFGVWVGDEIAPCLHIADIFVSEAHQRRGIGRALMENARAVAAERGSKQVFWTVWRENRAGQEFYRRLGAEPFEEEIFMRWEV